MDKMQENKTNLTKKQASTGSIVFLSIVLIIFICSMLYMCGTQDTEEQNESVRKIRDIVYENFIPNVYDKISNIDYYTDIQYRIDSFEVEFNNEISVDNAGIKFDIAPTGGLYETTWICFLDVYHVTYPLFYMTVKFSSSMQASKLSKGIYLVDGK